MTQDILPSLVSRLLQKNKVAFDKKELTFQIQSHPSYPSLHAITGVLDHFKIENIAARIPTDEESLNQLPETFLAQVENDLVVASRNKKGFQVLGSSLKAESWSVKDFLEKFGGVVVAVEQPEESLDTSKNSYQSNILPGVTGLILLTLLFISGPAPASIIFLILALLGTGISLTIVRQESGISTSLGNTFCSNASEKKDCDAVLNSAGATILGKYKFSDLSLVYFISLSLASIVGIIQGQNVAGAYYLSLLSLPVTLYSIYYQWVVIKKWCLLCLSIVGVLWAQAGLAIFTTGLNTPLTTDSVLLLSLIVLASFGLWTYLRSQQEELRSIQKARTDHFKFKRNFELFSTLLHQQEAIDTTISNKEEIVFGNAQALTSITLVTNPFCGHCKPVHGLVEDILGRYSELVKITIRFNIRHDDPESELVTITTRLIELYEKRGKDICLMAMSEIYGEITVEDWFVKWAECSDPDRYLKVLEEGKAWCHTHKINFTPEILINGRPFPRAYDRPDLIYFIEDLSEANLSQTTAEAEINAMA
ncbi:MAG: vitamin K epoxide reductase family protein [Roseivirga sp.]|nr:vitamin K epoxide reductase family protein [Roseivirga sp.]